MVHLECVCNELNSNSTNCDKVTGQCSCKNGFAGQECNKCHEKYFDYPNCKGI